jgi:hypothetical protein
LVLSLFPAMLVWLPFQPLEVSLVGLRASVLFLPAMLLGARLKDQDLSRLATGCAVLNLFALGVAIAEYFLGVTRFYPRNEITDLVYNMNDVAGYTAFRIPATFSQAHVYAGTMLYTIPLLYGAAASRSVMPKARFLAMTGLVAAIFGVLLSASRTAFIHVTALCLFILFTSSAPKRLKGAFVLVLLGVAMVTAANVRLQRFTMLKDADNVESRVAGSVNMYFFELLGKYPLGNGLGGGGTSIPYFWQGRVRHPVGMENEYCRLLIEQTPIGLLLWIGFIIWIATTSRAFVPAVWKDGRKTAWFVIVGAFLNGLIGIGMFTAVPQSLMFFLMIGWVASPPASKVVRFRQRMRSFNRTPATAPLTGSA